MLVEPFLPSQAHSSGDTFTEDTKELRERARRIRKDKWLERMKTEDEVTERGSESWVKDAGNAMLNQYGDLDPSSLNDRHRRRLDLGQKFVHFMDVVLETQHPRGAEEQIDIAYGMHGTDKYGRRVNLQGSGGEESATRSCHALDRAFCQQSLRTCRTITIRSTGRMSTSSGVSIHPRNKKHPVPANSGKPLALQYADTIIHSTIRSTSKQLGLSF